MSKRVAFFDNARFFLILTVIVGHCVAQWTSSSDFSKNIYIFIYSFHMPAFVLITGYMAKNVKWDKKNFKRILFHLFIPYIVFETITQFYLYYYKDIDAINILSPAWIGWFFAAMIIWRALTPILVKTPHIIVISIVISLASGLIEMPSEFALHKAVGLLPFYVIGLKINANVFEKLNTKINATVGAILLILAAIIISILTALNIDFALIWLRWKEQYSAVGIEATAIEGIFIRLGLIGLSLLLTFSFLALISHRHSRITTWGANSLYGFILHGYIILFLKFNFGFFNRVEDYSPAMLSLILIAGILGGIALMTNTVAYYTKYIVTPPLEKLFTK